MQEGLEKRREHDREGEEMKQVFSEHLQYIEAVPKVKSDQVEFSPEIRVPELRQKMSPDLGAKEGGTSRVLPKKKLKVVTREMGALGQCGYGPQNWPKPAVLGGPHMLRKKI